MLCIQGSPLYQWDRNRRLEINAADLGTNFEIHCCHKDDKTVLMVEPIIDGDIVVVNIPNILLQKSGFLRVYIVCDGDTVYDSSFYIMARPKPNDYAYTETEVMTWAQFEERLDNLEESVADGVPDDKIAEVVESYMRENEINGTDDNAVHYTPEEKTDEEKQIARDNIGAASIEHTMENAKDMGITSVLDSTDFFVIYDLPGGRHAKISWQSLRGIIQTRLEGRLTALAVGDEAETGYKATIPELEDDAVLALLSDITNALVDYYKKAETYSRTEIDGKIKTVSDNAQPKGDYAYKSDIPDIPDVPVKSVNNKTGAVQLNADDVGARPNTWTPTYTEVGADKSGTAVSAVGTHNVATDSHNDIRLLIEGLASRLNALADSDDDTLDQMSEIVAYIKANKALIDSITTSKVNVSDIVNNLATNTSSKPLSAAQGVALKALIDAITVPTKLSELAEDTAHRTVTDAEKSAWNAKSDFSGKYADLDGKPTIPTKVSAFENDKGYLTSFTESDPTVPAWAKASTKPKYTASEVGAAPSDKTIALTGVDESGNTHTWTVYGV